MLKGQGIPSGSNGLYGEQYLGKKLGWECQQNEQWPKCPKGQILLGVSRGSAGRRLELGRNGGREIRARMFWNGNGMAKRGEDSRAGLAMFTMKNGYSSVRNVH